MTNMRTGEVFLRLAAADAARAATVFDHPQSAAELLKTILAVPASELSQAQVLTGQFVQRRQLVGISRPLTSRGDFMLARTEGMYWHTATPFDNEFILTREGMMLRDAGASADGGPSATQKSAREQPALRMALEMFFALFALDVKQLERHFELFGRSTAKGWELGLRPRKSTLSVLFKHAVMSGGRQVQRIELTGADGDVTQIELSELAARGGDLTVVERRRFRR